MLKHTDMTSGRIHTEAATLPSNITSIEVSHDGGRLDISINRKSVFYSLSGTEDCIVTIDNLPVGGLRGH